MEKEIRLLDYFISRLETLEGKSYCIDKMQDIRIKQIELGDIPKTPDTLKSLLDVAEMMLKKAALFEETENIIKDDNFDIVSQFEVIDDNINQLHDITDKIFKTLSELG